MKAFWNGLLSAVAGCGVGIVLSVILLNIFPVDNCPGELDGLTIVFECPKYHPIKWVGYLPLIGWITGPLLLNLVYYRRYHRRLFNTNKIFLWVFASGIVLAFTAFLILGWMSQEIMKVI